MKELYFNGIWWEPAAASINLISFVGARRKNWHTALTESVVWGLSVSISASLTNLRSRGMTIVWGENHQGGDVSYLLILLPWHFIISHLLVKTVTDFIFLGFKISVDGDCSHEIKRWLHLERKAMANPDRVLKSRYVTDRGPHSQNYGFSSSHVWFWELDHKEGRALQKWCFQAVVLEKTLESPLNCKEIKLVNPKGNQPWIFIGWTDVKAEALILWPPDMKSQLIGKKPVAGKD